MIIDRKERAKLILGKLKKEFPEVSTALEHKNAYELLVATVLSAQCTDERVNKTTPQLFKKYPTIYDLAKGSQNELVEDISNISLRNNKSKNLISLAEIIVNDFNGIIPDQLDDLTSLPGVGKKTANVVLGEWYGIASGFIVDTHVKRCAYRMKLTNSKKIPEVEKDLMEVFPKEEWIDTASRIIFHGRTTCSANRRYGEECSLGDLCVVRD